MSNANVHAVTFSMVREAILAATARLKRPVTKDDLGIALASSSHKHATTLQALYQQSPQKGSFLRWCENEVGWYGAQWTRLDQGSSAKPLPLNATEAQRIRQARLGIVRYPGTPHRYDAAPTTAVGAIRVKGDGGPAPADVRLAIEMRAMECAQEWIQETWPHAAPDPRPGTPGIPYDFVVTQPGAPDRYVEVKGRSPGWSDLSSVELTHGEVRHARDHPEDSALVVVSGIEVLRLLDGSVVGTQGDVRVCFPFAPTDNDLEIVRYRFRPDCLPWERKEE